MSPTPDNVDSKAMQKGDSARWSHQSSPSSTESLHQPSNTHLPAPNPNSRHLESPEPLDEDLPPKANHPPELPADPPQQASTGNRRYKKDVSTMEERLHSMPEKRPLPWRPGVEAGAEIETGGESRRKQIRFGCLLATRGDVITPACLSCANGRGKFALCVALEGYFKGACASCQLSGRPNKCSIKINDDLAQSPKIESTTGSPAALQAGPPVKRKRTSTSALADWENSRPQWESDGDPYTRQQMAVNEIIHHARPAPAPAPAPALPMQNSWATVNAPMPPQPREYSSSHPAPSVPAGGWASVNQPILRPELPSIRSLDDMRESNASGEKIGGINGMRGKLEQIGREEKIPETEPIAMIDTLAKAQQRQVYGLISGLEGGIEQLQRELTSLKKALGLDE